VSRTAPLLTSLLLAAGLAGCLGASGEQAADQQEIRLAAALVTPTDIVLTWTAHDGNVAGRVVEFATEPSGPYTILQFAPPRQMTYAHPDLIPQTPFYYRIRPYYGPASRPVQVTLPEGGLDEKAEQDDHDWAYPRAVSRGAATKARLRGTNAAAAAPTDLKAAVMHANGIRFTWTDHASDEEGYLLEIRPAGSDDYRVAAVLDPDIDSFGLITLPDEKKASYRVRAFYYGRASNLAHQTTGREPPSTQDAGQR
jgi:hypothetical protein